MKTRGRFRRAFVGGAALGLLGLGPVLSAPPAAAGDRVVSVAFQYVPPTLTIAPGETFDYTNLDVAPHNVASLATGPDGNLLFGSATVRAGATVPVVGVDTLEPGTYDYTCTLHPDMLGSLTVGGSVAVAPAPVAAVPTPASIEVVDGVVYAVSYQHGSVFAADLVEGGAAGPALPYITGLEGPIGLAFGPDGTAFVSDSHASDVPGRGLGRVRAVPPGGGAAGKVGQIVIDGLPTGRHVTNDLTVHNGRLYVTNGNSTDDGVTGGAPETPLSGTLLSVPLGARGVSPGSPALVVEATGMRNVYDVAFRPGTNEAWMTTNGPDALDPFGEDTLVKVDVSGPPVDFGFPGCVYKASRHGPEVGQNPAVAATKKCSPGHRRPEQLMGLHVSANGLAFGPGDGWGRDLYVVEWGSNPGETPAGRKLVKVPMVGGAAGMPIDVLSLPGPLDVAFGPAGMYVADFVASAILHIRTVG